MSTSNKAWFAGVFALFAGRGLLIATWSNQGPQMQSELKLDGPQMGFFLMTISLASLLGVLVANRVMHRLGSRNTSLLTYIAMGLALIGLGFSVSSNSMLAAIVCTIAVGIPFGIADYDNNYEAGDIDRRSGRSRVPMLHFGYSIAVLGGSALMSLLIGLQVRLEVTFAFVGLAIIVASSIAAVKIPSSNGKAIATQEAGDGSITMLEVLRDSRNFKLVAIALAFVISEGSAALWIPITLTTDGESGAFAAFAFTVFAIGMAVMRLLGGKIVDALGRVRVVSYSMVLALVGMAIFMATPWLGLPLVGIAVWGIGEAIGMSIVVSAIADDHSAAAKKSTLLWLVVYLGNLSVGPVLGMLSAAIGNYLAFSFPFVILLIGLLFRKSVIQAAR